MRKQVEKNKEHKNQPFTNPASQKQQSGESASRFTDNRPEAITYRKLKEMAGKHSFQEQSIRKNENNKYINTNFTSGEKGQTYFSRNQPAQLKIKFNGSTFHKSPDREDFSSRIQSALGVDHETARCHVISYKAICDTITKILNDYYSKRKDATTTVTDLKTLLSAVYPYGGIAHTHGSHPNHGDLEHIAGEFYSAADKIIDNLPNNAKTLAYLESLGNRLVHYLNNSPDNLRPAYKRPNSSLGEIIDPRGSDIKRHIDPTDKRIWYEISGTSAIQIIRLAQVNEDAVKFGVSDMILQHSEAKDMTSKKMGSVTQVGGYTIGLTPPGGADPTDYFTAR